MFLGSCYTRHDVAFAYAWYSLLWAPSGYEARLSRMGVHLGVCARLETEDEGVKQVYGAIVKREHPLYVGFERLQKRAKGRLGKLSWPGTWNMRGGCRMWLRELGILEAVEAMVSQ